MSLQNKVNLLMHLANRMMPFYVKHPPHIYVDLLEFNLSDDDCLFVFCFFK